MRAIFLGLGAVFLSATFVFAGNGLLVVLLPLRGVAEGFSTLSLGSLGSAFAFGFIAGCLWGPHVIRRVGHIRALAVFASAASCAAIGYALSVDPIAWLALRALSGAALSGLFMVLESWLSERSENATRGRIFSIYLIINYGASTGGQLMVATGNPSDFALFAVAAMFLCISLIPVSLTTAIGPAPIRTAKLNFGRIVRVSPIAAVGAVLIGMSNSAFGTMGAVFAAQSGFGALDAALFVSAAIFGAGLMQTPAGWLSDRVDRRYVIVLLAAGAALIGVTMALSSTGALPIDASGALGLSEPQAWALAAGLFGAFGYSLYGVCAAHMNDFVEPDGFVEASSSILLLWSIGAVCGPILASSAMSVTGPHALFFVTAAAHAAIAVFAVYRMSRRQAPKKGEKDRFVAASAARTTPQAVGLDPRASRGGAAKPTEVAPTGTARSGNADSD